MSRPLIFVLQLAALILILRAYMTESPMLYMWAALCAIPSAIAIRKRLRSK